MTETTRMQPRGIPPLYFLGCLAVMILLHLKVPGARWLGSPWHYVGFVPILVAAGMGVPGALLFAKRRTAISPLDEPTFLIMEGPFRCSRNPLYASLALTLVGVALLLGTVSPLVVPPLFMLLITQGFILKEEEALERKFGEAYLAYKRSVCRWFGRYKAG